MSGNIIGVRPIFLDLDFWMKRPSHKNGITFQAIKWEGLILTKNISCKKFLECYKDQMSGNNIGLRPTFLDLDFWLRRPSHKNGITFQARKWELLIFTKNASGKMFLECYNYQNEWQHHRATTNISRPWFLAEKPSHKNGISFQDRKWERLFFMKNVSKQNVVRML